MMSCAGLRPQYLFGWFVGRKMHVRNVRSVNDTWSSIFLDKPDWVFFASRTPTRCLPSRMHRPVRSCSFNYRNTMLDRVHCLGYILCKRRFVSLLYSRIQVTGCRYTDTFILLVTTVGITCQHGNQSPEGVIRSNFRNVAYMNHSLPETMGNVQHSVQRFLQTLKNQLVTARLLI